MNLGNRRITNDALRAAFETIGFAGVVTFRASGNVIFTADDDEAAVTNRVEEGLSEHLGYEVPTFVRSAAELEAMAAYQPFPAEQVEASNGKLQVGMLLRKPTAAKRKAVLAMATDEDPLELHERELYWLPSGGLLESDLDLDAIDKLIGPTTRRTKGTVEQLAKKLG